LESNQLFIGNIDILTSKSDLVDFLLEQIRLSFKKHKNLDKRIKRVHIQLKKEDFQESIRFRGFNQEHYEKQKDLHAQGEISKGVKSA